jgi:hypothetical protein
MVALMASFHASAATRPSEAEARGIMVWMKTRGLNMCISGGKGYRSDLRDTLT